MSNIYTPQQCHTNMATIYDTNPKPKVIVRHCLWGHGYRYRMNHPRLPEKPNIAMTKYRTCLFVNGCFWHGHDVCKYYTIPMTNTESLVNKVKRNKEHNNKVQCQLASKGWHCITIWECELKTAKRERALESLSFTLYNIFLQDHSTKRYEIPEEVPMMAADESPIYNTERE